MIHEADCIPGGYMKNNECMEYMVRREFNKCIVIIYSIVINFYSVDL